MFVRDQWQAMIFREDHVEAVRQRIFFKFGIVGRVISPDLSAVAVATAAFAAGFLSGGVFFAVSWLKTDTAAAGDGEAQDQHAIAQSKRSF